MDVHVTALFFSGQDAFLRSPAADRIWNAVCDETTVGEWFTLHALLDSPDFLAEAGLAHVNRETAGKYLRCVLANAMAQPGEPQLDRRGHGWRFIPRA